MKILIESKADAIEAAEAICDYADNNLSMMDAADMPEESIKLAKEMLEKAKAFREFLK